MITLCELFNASAGRADSTQSLNLENILVKGSRQLSDFVKRYRWPKGADRSWVKAYKRSQKLKTGMDRSYDWARSGHMEAPMTGARATVAVVTTVPTALTRCSRSTGRLVKSSSESGKNSQRRKVDDQLR